MKRRGAGEQYGEKGAGGRGRGGWRKQSKKARRRGEGKEEGEGSEGRNEGRDVCVEEEGRGRGASATFGQELNWDFEIVPFGEFCQLKCCGSCCVPS